MHKFEYRAPRFIVDLRIQLSLPSGKLAGRCGEISTDGMLTEFTQPLPPNSSGMVTFSWREQSVQVRVCVAHSGPEFDWLSFCFENDRDRRSFERMVTLLSAPAPRLGPVLVR